MAERLYTMKDVVDITGIPSTTLRFYDKKGMLAFVRRSVSGVRIFTDKDIALLRMIQFLRNVDMPIKEITHFISLYMEGASAEEERMSLLENHLLALRKEVREGKEKIRAAAFMNDLLQKKMDDKTLDSDLTYSLTDKDIPEDTKVFFSRRD